MMLRGPGKGGRTVVQSLDCGCWRYDDEPDGWHPYPSMERAVNDLLEAVAVIESRGSGVDFLELNTLGEQWARLTDAAALVRSLREGNEEQ